MRISDWSFRRVLFRSPPRIAAPLPGAQESRLDDEDSRGADVGGVPHDDRVVAAHFQREHLARLARELAVERKPRARRSGKQQPVDAVMARERLARIGAPDDEAQHLLRYARAVKQLDEDRKSTRLNSSH